MVGAYGRRVRECRVTAVENKIIRRSVRACAENVGVMKF